MGPPYEAYHYNFRAYRDYLSAHPAWARSLPVYITETDQVDPWADTNSGWVRSAYREIDDWNKTPGTQRIRSLLLYRFCPGCDQWDITPKGGVIADFRQAMDNDYRWGTDTAGCTANVAVDHWKGEYFANRTLSGVPVLVRDDGISALDFDWGAAGPNACGVGSDLFSARFTRTVFFNAGTYRFTATTDDGVRLYVDGVLRIDKWLDQGPTLVFRRPRPRGGQSHRGAALLRERRGCRGQAQLGVPGGRRRGFGREGARLDLGAPDPRAGRDADGHGPGAEHRHRYLERGGPGTPGSGARKHGRLGRLLLRRLLQEPGDARAYLCAVGSRGGHRRAELQRDRPGKRAVACWPSRW